MQGGLRRIAQRIRHAPVLRRFDTLWRLVRPFYNRLLRRVSQHGGLPIVVGGQSMRLHADMASTSWESVERESYGAFQDALSEGMVVYDIGAHIGTYAVIASRAVGSSGLVLAFEPDAVARGYLEQHLEWNDCLGNTEVCDACVGAEVGEREFYALPGEASARSGFLPQPGFEARLMNVTTIDQQAETRGRPPGLIKIDVEGGEWDVLRGAERTLHEGRPELLLSLHPDALADLGVSELLILDWLGERGYEVSVLGRDHEVHLRATPRRT